METVAIIGASTNPNRYSNMAQHRLLEAGHKVIPITPNHQSIEGLSCFKQLTDVPSLIDTITVYINPSIINTVIDDMIEANPKRVIFNPGSESAPAMAALKEKNIEVIEACTLVMLATHQF